MKIDNVSSGHMLHKGIMESYQVKINEQEAERKKAALGTEKPVKPGFENKGFHFDVTA